LWAQFNLSPSHSPGQSTTVKCQACESQHSKTPAVVCPCREWVWPMTRPARRLKMVPKYAQTSALASLHSTRCFLVKLMGGSNSVSRLKPLRLGSPTDKILILRSYREIENFVDLLDFPR